MKMGKWVLALFGTSVLGIQVVFSEDNFPTLKEKLDRMGYHYPNINSLGDFERVGADEAVNFIKMFNRTGGPGFEETIKKVGEFAARNPEVEALVTEKLTSLPNLVETNAPRDTYFRILGRMKSQWALDLAGRILLEAKPLRTEMFDGDIGAAMKAGGGGTGNATYAAWAIGAIGYPGYPNGGLGYYDLNYDEELVERCRKWWKENSMKAVAGAVDTGQKPDPKPKQDTATPEPTFAKKPPVPDEKAAEAEVSDVEVDTRPFPWWVLVIVGIVTLGLVITALFRRR